VFNRNEYQEYFLGGKDGQLTIIIMALGLTQCLTEMSIRNISWGGKDGQLTIIIMALGLTQCLTEMSIRNISWG